MFKEDCLDKQGLWSFTVLLCLVLFSSFFRESLPDRLTLLCVILLRIWGYLVKYFVMSFIVK